MTTESLPAWLDGVERWIQTPPRRARYWRQKLHGVEGIIEVGFNQHAQTATAAYSIHSSQFDVLAHGKKLRRGGILVVQAGHAAAPFRSAVAVPEDQASVDHLTTTIDQEAPPFFSSFPNLRAVYEELISSRQRYPSAHPNAPSHRQMFAAAVGFLIGENWQPLINQALDAVEVESARSWILEVKERLERASG